MLVAVAFLCQRSLGIEQGMTQDVQVRLAGAQAALRSASSAPTPFALTGQHLAPPTSIDTLLSYLHKSADRAGAQVKVLAIERGQPTDRTWGESRLRLSIASRYTELKALLADLTGAYSSLALTNISLRPSPTPGGMLDAEIVLVLYHR